MDTDPKLTLADLESPPYLPSTSSASAAVDALKEYFFKTNSNLLDRNEVVNDTLRVSTINLCRSCDIKGLRDIVVYPEDSFTTIPTEFDVYFAADSRRLKTLFKALTKGKLERPFIVLFNGVDPRSASDIVKENLPLLNKMLSAVIWICAQGSHELHKASLNLQVELLDEELQNEKKASGEFLEDYNKEKRKRIKAEKKKGK